MRAEKMSAEKRSFGRRQRALLARVLLVAFLTGMLALSFYSGRGHTILIDNKDSPDGSISAIDGVLVSIDGFEALELYAGDRDMQKVKGQRHTVKVEIINDGAITERTIELPLMSDMMLLSVPKMVTGIEPILETFVPLNVAPSSDESVGNTNSFTSPDAATGADEIPVFQSIQ